MSEGTKTIRLSKAATEFNVGVSTIVEFLLKKGEKIDSNPNTKLSPEMYNLLVKEFQPDKAAKEISKKIGLEYTQLQAPTTETRKPAEEKEEAEPNELVIRTLNFHAKHDKPAETEEKPVVSETEEKPKKTKKTVEKPEELVVVEKEATPPVVEKEVPANEPETKEVVAVESTNPETAQPEPGIKIVGKIDLSQFATPAKGKSKSAKTAEKEAKTPKKGKDAEPEQDVAAESVKQETPQNEIIEETVTPPVVEKEELVAPEESKQDLNPNGIYTKEDPNFISTKVPTLEGVKVLGKIELPVFQKPEPQKPAATSSDENRAGKKKKRKRIKAKENVSGIEGENKTDPSNPKDPKKVGPQPLHRPADKNKGKKYGKVIEPRVEPSEEEVQKQIRETLQRLSAGTGKSKASKHRREKRQAEAIQQEETRARLEEEKNVLKVTEFVTANDLANMMNLPVTKIIATCMSVGMFVSINQRLDAEAISLLADEFGFKVEFVGVEVQESIDSKELDAEEDTEPRPPIVTVMGHVDHGKTSLLDYIRKANVIAGEAGGITQHIGAYEVTHKDGRKITFLDTPGHEAFTAMRARGAKITDLVIIVIAADDTVMPQTIEAINHAQAAGVPMVFAINKIDKPGANPEKIKEALSKLNILVEDWGGKYQSQEISAKKGIHVEELLEKVLLEAELLDLKANPNRNAYGAVLESSLDKGRGYVAKMLVQNGTIRVGDFVLAGSVYGKVKAMYNERNNLIKEAGPATPLLLLGLAGAPQAGDMFNVMSDEREAKALAAKRQQLQREQGLRTQKHVTLDEIGRRIAIGDFKELNIIVKADVDGSVEALSDSLLKLSTEQVQVNVIHKSVGAITESDVLLASASNAIVVGFQVRPTSNARKLAEREEIDIRLYSIIYSAIEEIKSAIEGMLSPEIEEKIICNVEIREVFRITKVGSVAGCMVLDGKITRNTQIRLIRDGIVVYTGRLGSLKRYKDDVKEVSAGYECGLNIESYNDIKVGDIVEGFETIEVKRKL